MLPMPLGPRALPARIFFPCLHDVSHSVCDLQLRASHSSSHSSVCFLCSHDFLQVDSASVDRFDERGLCGSAFDISEVKKQYIHTSDDTLEVLIHLVLEAACIPRHNIQLAVWTEGSLHWHLDSCVLLHRGDREVIHKV